MVLKGVIYEGINRSFFYEEKAFFLGYGSVWEMVGSVLNCFYKQPEDCYSSIALDGFWITKKTGKTHFHDLFYTKKSYPSLNFEQSKSIKIFDNYLLCEDIYEEKLHLIKIDDWSFCSKNYEGTAKFSIDGDLFIRFLFPNKVIYFDKNLDVIWEYILEGEHYLDFELKPQIHNDLLIINHAWDTIALNKYTGEEVWKYTFEEIPTSNVLMQGKVYAVCNAILYVIDPNTGQVEWTKETGFPVNKFNNPKERNRIGVFPVGNYLYGVAQFDENHEWLRLYNYDASVVLDKKTIPDYWLNPYGSILPTIHNGKIYQQVRNSYAFSSSGMMVIDIVDDNTKAKIIVSPRPAVTMMANPSLSAPHKLEIYLDVDNLDDALRYGELLTQELCYATGYIGIYELRKNALDRKHNGIVELIIDDAGFKSQQEKDEYLIAFTERLNKNFEDDVAGDKKTPIKFKLTRKPKDSWDMSGEKLDWPAIRDQETPLS